MNQKVGARNRARAFVYSTIILFVIVLLSACGPVTQFEARGSAPFPSVTLQLPSTATTTPTPTRTGTATIAPTVTPAHFLSVEYLHQQSYSGNLLIEEELDHADVYYRYIVSYLSEGYKNFALLTIPTLSLIHI